MAMEQKREQNYFGGKLENTMWTNGKPNYKDEDERAKEKKHLKAFLRGDTRFAHGKNKLDGKPIWHPVIRLEKPKQ